MPKISRCMVLRAGNMHRSFHLYIQKATNGPNAHSIAFSLGILIQNVITVFGGCTTTSCVIQKPFSKGTFVGINVSHKNYPQLASVQTVGGLITVTVMERKYSHVRLVQQFCKRESYRFCSKYTVYVTMGRLESQLAVMRFMLSYLSSEAII